MKISKLIIILVISMLCVSTISVAADKIIPNFKVAGTYQTFVNIVVPENTTKAQLINLINEFKKAREGKYLDKYLPPTTPNGKMGKYAIVGVNVFSDPQMGTSDKLKKYMEASSDNQAEVKSSQRYASKVLAHYYYSIVSDQEFGCLGLRDPGIKPTPTYQKLFGKNIPY